MKLQHTSSRFCTARFVEQRILSRNTPEIRRLRESHLLHHPATVSQFRISARMGPREVVLLAALVAMAEGFVPPLAGLLHCRCPCVLDRGCVRRVLQPVASSPPHAYVRQIDDRIPPAWRVSGRPPSGRGSWCCPLEPAERLPCFERSGQAPRCIGEEQKSGASRIFAS